MRVFGKLVVSILACGSFASPLRAHPPHPQAAQSVPVSQSSRSPLTLDEAIHLIKQGKKDPQVASTIADRGVDFELDEKTEKKLRKAGADEELLPEIWKATPSGKAHMQALLTTPSGIEVQASAGEALAVEEIQDERAADRRVVMATEFDKKFPNSLLLSYVYTIVAKAHQEKGESDAAIQAARKSLELDHDNTYSLIIMALLLPDPKELQGSPKEASERVQEANTDAKRALVLLEKLSPQPGETDQQFQQRKRSLAADAHFALGMAATQQDHFEEALAEYKAAIGSTSSPTFQYEYRLGEAYASLGRISEAIAALQKASDLARGTPMQKFAEDFIAELRQKGHQ